MLILLAVAIPQQLNLDPAVCVAVNFAVGRAGDDGRLVTGDVRFFQQGRPKRNVARRCTERVAITLETSFASRHFFQHLRLSAMVFDFRDQPFNIAVVTRVIDKLQEMPAGQRRLVAGTVRLPGVDITPFERSPGQLLAIFTVGELTGELVILERR